MNTPSFHNTVRPPRLLSLEQEFTAGTDAVTSALGLDNYGYHSGPREDRSLTTEDDSSCDGELIYGRWDLNDAESAGLFGRVVELVDEVRAAGECKIGYAAGLHVHVDMTRETFATIRALYLVFNHLEDCLYRLASAGYRQHRDGYTGSDYSVPPRKGLRTAVEIDRAFRHGRGGLNLSNYLESVLQCECGASRLGAWDECTCTTRQPTVEFRLWNATTRPRKVHAYCALSHALVEWAHNNPGAKVERLSERPYAPNRPNPAQLRASLSFILGKLPLSASERVSILWTARRSSILTVCGADFLNELDERYAGTTTTSVETFAGSGIPAREDSTEQEMVGALHSAGYRDEDDDYNEPDGEEF